MNYLPPRLQAALDARLHDGEHALWVGQPNPGHMARLYVPQAIFGILFCGGIVLMHSIGTPSTEHHNSTNLIVLFFVGLLMVFAPLNGRGEALHTVYAVTEKRAIIMRTYFGKYWV